MSSSLSSRICVTCLICVVGADGAPVRVNLAAQAAATQQKAPAQPVVPASALTVTGFVLRNDRKTHVPDVKERIRNITTGAVVGTSVSDRNGAFSFQAPEPGLYVIEAVRDDGSIEAISAKFMMTDTTVRRDVILPGPLGLGAIITSDLVAVLAAGTASGLIPVIPPGGGPGQVASPER
jgi:hypothetical protein